MDSHTHSAEVPTPPEGCCKCCGDELGLGLTQVRKAEGKPGICLGCAQLLDSDAEYLDDVRAIYRTTIEAYP